MMRNEKKTLCYASIKDFVFFFSPLGSQNVDFLLENLTSRREDRVDGFLSTSAPFLYSEFDLMQSNECSEAKQTRLFSPSLFWSRIFKWAP